MGKFDSQSDEGVFLGYSINSRAYRVFNLHTLTMMEYVNVVIDDWEIDCLTALNDMVDIIGTSNIWETFLLFR